MAAGDRAENGAALAALRDAFGAPPAPQPTDPDRPGISLRQLADFGFGDQLLQYGIARLIAERHKLALVEE